MSSNASGGSEGGGSSRADPRLLPGQGAEPEFVGYEYMRTETGIGSLRAVNGSASPSSNRVPSTPRAAASPTPAGSSGTVAKVEVADVIRVGEDQVLELKPAAEGEAALAPAGRRLKRWSTGEARFPDHAQSHGHHPASRCPARTARQPRPPGRLFGPPGKLRFDFSHGEAMTPEDIIWVEERVNGWIRDGDPVRWMIMEKARRPKLGRWRCSARNTATWSVVEVENVSRELCGGTHVDNTAEIGIFKIVHEFSAANVRRIEAITGPDAIDWFRDRASELNEIGHLLGDARDPVRAARDASEKTCGGQRRRKQAARQQQVSSPPIWPGRPKRLAASAWCWPKCRSATRPRSFRSPSRFRGTSGATAVLAGADPETGSRHGRPAYLR